MPDRFPGRSARAVRRAMLLASGLALCAAPAAAQENRFDWSEQMRPGETLRVHTVHGEIRTSRAAGSTAVVRGSGRADSRGRFDLRFEARRVADGFVVCALYEDESSCNDQGIRSRNRSRSRSGRADFVVEVPQGVQLSVVTGNGDLTIAGATADVHARSGNGSVRVGAGAGRVEASSGNGAVDVDDARSAVRASSGNGAIRISTAAGPVSASTGNGGIQVRMASLRETGDMEFTSGNGSVTLLLPDDFAAEVSAQTGHGSFSVDFPLLTRGAISSTRLRGTIGDAGRRLSVSTGNGSISLRRATGG